MSEKHLTELPWKSLLTKHKLKDGGLGKALANFDKCGATEFEGRLKSLDGIEKEAAACKKEAGIKDNKEVTGYLGEIVSEISKQRKAIEAEQKANGDKGESEDDEGSGNPAAIKKRLIGQLATVKATAPGEPSLSFMACVGEGGCGVLLGRSIGATQKKILLEILPTVKGPRFFRGECIWEENLHTFVLEKVPAGLSKKLQRALLAETGKKYRVRVRSADGATVADSETELEQELATDAGEAAGFAVPGPASPPVAAAADHRAEWLTLKGQLSPAIKASLTAWPERRDAVMKLLGEVVGKEKAQDYAAAIALGQQLLASLQAQPAPAAEKLADDSKPAAALMAALQGAVAKVVPKVKDFIAATPGRKNEILQLLAAFREQLNAGDPVAARQQLALLAAAMGKSPPATAQNTSGSPLNTLAQAIAGWQAARLEIVATLTALVNAIRGMNDPQGDEAIILLLAIRANLTVNPDTAQKVKELEDYLTTDRIIEDAETPNGLGVVVKIREPLMAALARIRGSLPIAA